MQKEYYTLCLAGFIYFITAHSEEITFTKDIAPIIFENCTYCHRPGQSAPFSLQNYRDASRRSMTMAKVVKKKIMPPWHAIDGHLPFKGDRRLTEHQIQLICDWVDQDCPEGDPEHLPPVPEYPSEKWDAGEPDLILEMTESYSLPADGPDIYKEFTIPISSHITTKKYLKSIAFIPSNPKVVHHSLFYLEQKGIRSRQYIGGWAPGSRTMFLPEGLSNILLPGSQLILSTHFHLTGKPEEEKSTVGLYFDDKPPMRNMAQLQLPPHFGILKGFDILPGKKETVLIDRFLLPVPAKAFWVSAHAHYLGKSLSLTAKLPNDKAVKLLNIPDWDINWQEVYALEKHFSLPKGTILISKVTWDNTEDNSNNPFDPPQRVRWGKESFDEMAALDIFLILESKDDKETLSKAYDKHIETSWYDHLYSDKKLRFANQLRQKAMRKFDLDRDGLLNIHEKNLAKKHLKQIDIQK